MRSEVLNERPSGIYLPNESAVRRLRAALARPAWGGTPARIMFKGDSTTFGVIGGGGNGASAVYNPANLVLPQAISWVDRCRRLLNTTGEMGGRVDEGALWQTGGETGLAGSRITVGTGWTTGGVWAATTSTSGVFTFTDTGGSANALDIYIRRTSGTSVTVPVTIDAEAPTSITVTVNNALGPHRVTSTGGVGAHTYVIGAPTGGNIEIFAVQAVNTVTPPVATFSRNGISGYQLASLMTTTGVTGNYWATHTQYLPDAAFLLMGINDLHFTAAATIAEATATFKTNLISYVMTTQAINCDVILGVFPANGYAAAQLNPGPYEAVRFHRAIYEVADQYNCAVFDLQRRWGYGSAPMATTGTPTPTPMYDGVHPTLAGYQDMARMMARFFSHVL